MTLPRSSRPLRDAALALSLLTALPMRVEWPRGERPDVAGYFPFAGLVLGAVTSAFFAAAVTFVPRVGALLPTHAYLFALLVVAAWAGATRMLHWDGLADVADAIWGAHGPGRRLEILADSATGAFGTTAVVLVALAQVIAIALLLPAGAFAVLVLVPVAGRLSASIGAWLGRPVRPAGLGAAVAGRPGAASLLAAAVCVGAAVALCFATLPGSGAALLAGVALLTAAAVPHLLAKSFGGITGDVLGASVLLTETVVLVAAALVVA